MARAMKVLPFPTPLFTAFLADRRQEGVAKRQLGQHPA